MTNRPRINDEVGAVGKIDDVIKGIKGKLVIGSAVTQYNWKPIEAGGKFA